jgi:D5 N terminal like
MMPDITQLVAQEFASLRAEHATGTVEPAPAELLSQHFSDYGNAQRVIVLHGGNLRYCHAFAKWLVWDGWRWAVDEGERARELSQAPSLEFARQALAAKSETAAKFAAGCLNSQPISNALREAQPLLAIRPAELDIQLLQRDRGSKNGLSAPASPRRLHH